MAIALVTNIEAGGTAGGVTTGAFDSSGATLLVAVVAYFNASAMTTAHISDSKGNTWSQATNYTLSSRSLRTFYCVPSSVGSGHTFTVSMSASYPSVCVLAFSGTGAAPGDQQNGNISSNMPGSVTPTEDNEVLVCGVMNTGGTLSSISGGFTIAGTVAYAGGLHMGVGAAYKIQTTAGPENPAWNSTTNNGTNIVTFKEGVLIPPTTGKLLSRRRRMAA